MRYIADAPLSALTRVYLEKAAAADALAGLASAAQGPDCAPPLAAALALNDTNDRTAAELLDAPDGPEDEDAPLYARNPDTGTCHILACPDDFGGRGVKSSLCLRACPPEFFFSSSCEDDWRICRDCVKKICKVVDAT